MSDISDKTSGKAEKEKAKKAAKNEKSSKEKSSKEKSSKDKAGKKDKKGKKAALLEQAQATHLLQSMIDAGSASDAATLVLFGVTGDLVRRKLLPALFRLYRDGLLADGIRILGVGRRDLSDSDFRNLAEKSLRESKETGALEEDLLQQFLGRLAYRWGDFDGEQLYRDIAAYCAAEESVGVLFYLSLLPSLFITVSDSLAGAGLNDEAQGWRRLVVEKPFGRDLDTALELQQQLTRHWHESQIYRIDHYLGKETVQNLLAVRFGNAIFEPLWNRDMIDHVQITAAEDLGLEGRAGYYEESGAVRDMLQNHLLQLLALTAMEPPAPGSPDALRDEKVKALRAVTRITPQEADRVAVRGQYTAGTLGGQELGGYQQEDGVRPSSPTPTFVAVRLEVDNWRWRGVPFYLRSGKRMPKKLTEIAVVFRQPPLHLFPGMQPNALIFRIQPDEGISLSINTKTPGPDLNARETALEFRYDTYSGTLTSPYARLLLDALNGDASLFPRAEEVMESWRIVQGLLDAWETAEGQPRPYPSGSWGPEAADALMDEGQHWRN